MKSKELDKLQEKLVVFAKNRDWMKFHSPKNLAMALSGEVGELVEVFQWLTEKESQNLTAKQHALVEEEVGDIFIYLLQLTDKLNIDLVKAAENKLCLNERKYPVEFCFGTAKKYTEL